MLLPDFQRMQYLEYDAIREDDEYFRDVINPQFCFVAPMLRRLLLTVLPPEPLHAPASQLDDDKVEPRLPANIFGGTQAPLLDFLFLSGIKLPSWSSHILHNLTALFLDTQDRQTFAELSSALRNMPGLHTLVLSNCLPLDTPLGVGLIHPQKAQLLNLTRVDLCESEHVSAFLPFLKAVQIAPLEMEVSTTLGCPNELPFDAWAALLDACIEALTPHILSIFWEWVISLLQQAARKASAVISPLQYRLFAGVCVPDVKNVYGVILADLAHPFLAGLHWDKDALSEAWTGGIKHAVTIMWCGGGGREDIIEPHGDE
ncbi:hypothetical protein PLEOSDRAFT_1103901 [Pleurotus ostreatus PC15]|uniref:Uncharacterized protein n=1 Tax=Pleurotus ostreatus (strain PC15) TaxID=1137138 RepID=A0A067P207_PLEO1|nr:hypothetical protein PLEOSDRAFT_1103901 [Pleurotus ostreatus PC15]